MNELALIIEDDEDLANIFAEAVRGVGFEVEHVADGQKAQERLKSGTAPYLILLDMHLPHVSGEDLLMNTIKPDDRFKTSMIIITTADARMGDAYRDQVDFVLIKPISFVQLRDLTARLKPQQ
jgi:two-component system, OmpR family, response regulator VicR